MYLVVEHQEVRSRQRSQRMSDRRHRKGEAERCDGTEFISAQDIAHILVQLNFTHRRVKCSYLSNHAASVLGAMEAVLK